MRVQISPSIQRVFSLTAERCPFRGGDIGSNPITLAFLSLTQGIVCILAKDDILVRVQDERLINLVNGKN